MLFQFLSDGTDTAIDITCTELLTDVSNFGSGIIPLYYIFVSVSLCDNPRK